MDPIEEVGKEIDYGIVVQRKKKAKRTISHVSYTQQRVDLTKTPILFFPEGKEMLFLGIYFVTLPYITGLLFLFQGCFSSSSIFQKARQLYLIPSLSVQMRTSFLCG